MSIFDCTNPIISGHLAIGVLHHKPEATPRDATPKWHEPVVWDLLVVAVMACKGWESELGFLAPHHCVVSPEMILTRNEAFGWYCQDDAVQTELELALGA